MKFKKIIRKMCGFISTFLRYTIDAEYNRGMVQVKV